jgi:hypothetical protein
MMAIKRTPRLNSILSAIALAAVASTGQAGPVGPLTTFTAGTPAKASDVNGNFTTIVTTVNANDARLTTVETTKQNIVSGTCPAGSAIRVIAANGTVTCQSTGGAIGFASVAALIGVPRNSTTVTSQGNAASGEVGRFANSGADYLVAPMALPHGATVTSFSYSCVHNSGAAPCEGYLYRTDASQMAFVSISSLSTAVQTASTTSITTPVVDNQNFGYWVYMLVNGTAGSAILAIRANVTYTLP